MPVAVLLELAVEDAVLEEEADLDAVAVSDELLLDVPVRDPVAVPDELLLALADLDGVAVELVDRDALDDLVELNVAVAERLRAGERVEVTDAVCVFELLDVPDVVLEPVVVLELVEDTVDVRLVDGERVPVVVLEEDRVEEALRVENPDADTDKEGCAVIEDERDPTDVFVAAADRVDVRVAVAVREPTTEMSAKLRTCSYGSYTYWVLDINRWSPMSDLSSGVEGSVEAAYAKMRRLRVPIRRNILYMSLFFFSKRVYKLKLSLIII